MGLVLPKTRIRTIKSKNKEVKKNYKLAKFEKVKKLDEIVREKYNE
jgi:hypothetical protein